MSVKALKLQSNLPQTFDFTFLHNPLRAADIPVDFGPSSKQVI